LNAAMGASHSQTLTGLISNRLYHYRVKSKDAAGNLGISGDYTFTTTQRAAAPVISALTISGVTNKSATISWTTDKLADSAVEYSSSIQDVSTSALGDLVTKHSLTLNRLKKMTQYRFRVKSSDSSGNQVTSPEFAFTTSADGASVGVLPRFTLGQTLYASETASGPAPGEEIAIGMALTNLGSEPATLTFTAVDSAGNPLMGPDIENPKVMQLNPKAQFAKVDMQLFGEGFTAADNRGWIKAESNSPDVAGFFLTFDSVLSMMDGANFGDVPMTDFAFTEIEQFGSTKISVVNGNLEDASVTFNLTAADGTIRSSQSRTVPANGAFAADLYRDLFNGIEPAASDYVRVKSTASVLPFELMQQSAGDFSSLAGQDISAGGTTLYSPQYVLGGAWKTTLSIVNLDAKAGMVTLRFFGEDGTQIGMTRATTMEPHGKLQIDDPDFFAFLDCGQITAGYLEITSDGIRLAGSTVFGDSSGQSFSSALPLVYSLRRSMLFSHVASNDQYFTGIAILNPTTSDAEVTVELHGSDGSLIDVKKELIPARQKKARILTEFFPSLVGKDQASGYIRLASDQPIVSFSLFGTNNLSVLSAIPPQDVQ
jgi:hypothetical protein